MNAVRQKPRIIAVAGGSGSGKTTLVGRLTQALTDGGPSMAPAPGILVLQLDHYYLDQSHLPMTERDRVNFDHPDAFDTKLIQSQLAALAAGQAVDRPTYDYATHSRVEKKVRIDPAPVILVDGILSLHWPEIRKLLDLAVFVDVSDDVRFIRRLRRDVSERGRTVESVITQYLRSVKAMHDTYVAPQKFVADIIVSWMEYNERAVAMLAGMIQSWQQGARS